MSGRANRYTGAGGHVPVMLDEVVEIMAPRQGAGYADGTFGRGSYSRAILEAADCKVWGIDRDPEAIEAGRSMATEYDGRLRLINGRFGEMDRLLADDGAGKVDGITFDLGASSPQLDTPLRGFSFRHDGPLDMRMSGAEGVDAADAVNSLSEAELAEIIGRYGEERYAKRVARAIVAARQDKPIRRTGELADIVRRAVRRSADGLDPATRTFQALRIYVNDEIGELRRGLGAAERLLAPGGRLAVVSFHSLEDREVKAFLRARAGNAGGGSRHLPGPPKQGPEPSFTPLTRAARKPSPEECAANPRARSARLRAAARTAAPPWPPLTTEDLP